MEGVVGPLSSSDERKPVGVRGGGFQIGVGREGGGEGRLVRGPGSFSDTITGHRTPWPHSLQILHMNHSGYLLCKGKGGRDLLVFKAKIGSVNCF